MGVRDLLERKSRKVEGEESGSGRRRRSIEGERDGEEDESERMMP